MLGTPLNRRVRRVLGVSVDQGLSLTLVDTPTIYFPANLAEPVGENSSLDGSPRTSRAAWKLTWGASVTFLSACDRVEVPDDTTYELLADPRPVMNGRRVVGYSAPVLPISELYPRAALLAPLGAVEPLAAVECSTYSNRESSSGRGSYEDVFCELPPSAWEHIDGADNLELRFADGSAWKLSEAALSAEVPYVTATIRKAG